jgi:hypothetical protein
MPQRNIDSAFQARENAFIMPLSTPSGGPVMGMTQSLNAALVGAAFLFVGVMLFI